VLLTAVCALNVSATNEQFVFDHTVGQTGEITHTWVITSDPPTIMVTSFNVTTDGDTWTTQPASQEYYTDDNGYSEWSHIKVVAFGIGGNPEFSGTNDVYSWGVFEHIYDDLNGVTDDAWGMMGILPIVIIAGGILAIVMLLGSGAGLDPRIIIVILPVIIMLITALYVGIIIIDKLPK
jgi:hypothetical protein